MNVVINKSPQFIHLYYFQILASKLGQLQCRVQLQKLSPNSS
jgi:hypothetical protein